MKKWTKEEINFLTLNYKKMTFEEIAHIQHRTEKSVAKKAEKLKLHEKQFRVVITNKINHDEKLELINLEETLKVYPNYFDNTNESRYIIANCKTCKDLIHTRFYSFSGYCNKCVPRGNNHSCEEFDCKNQRKPCTTCKIVFPMVEFTQNILSPNGHDYTCKDCSAKKSQETRERNITANQNHDCYKDDCFNKFHYCKLCDTRHIRAHFVIARDSKDAHRYPCFFGLYQRNANINKTDFNLTKEEFWDLCLSTTTTCSYCKIPLEGFPSIDRINNTKGYTQDNVNVCCSICNYWKSWYPLKLFLYNLKYISEIETEWEYQLIFKMIKKKLNKPTDEQVKKYLENLQNNKGAFD